MKKLILWMLIFLLAGCSNSNKTEEKEYSLEDAIVYLKDNQFDFTKDYHLTVFEKCDEDEYSVSNEYFYHLEDTNIYLLDNYTFNNGGNYLLSYRISLADQINEDGFDLVSYSCNLNQTLMQEVDQLHQTSPIEENKIDFETFYADECKKVEINENEVTLTYDDYTITININDHEIVSYQVKYTNGTCMSTSLYSHDLEDHETQINKMKELIGKDIQEIEKMIPRDLDE